MASDRKTCGPAVLTVALLLAATYSNAVTTTSFKVSASVVSGCSISSGSGGALGTLNFGTHSGVESGNANAQFVPNASLSLSCTPGVALSMSINGGTHYTTVRNLQLSGGTDKVPYRLYSGSSSGTNSEIGINQKLSVTYSNSNNIALSLYGSAQLTGSSPAGNYSDQLTVTLSW